MKFTEWFFPLTSVALLCNTLVVQGVFHRERYQLPAVQCPQTRFPLATPTDFFLCET